jgi:hypothetical protein
LAEAGPAAPVTRVARGGPPGSCAVRSSAIGGLEAAVGLVAPWRATRARARADLRVGR